MEPGKSRDAEVGRGNSSNHITFVLVSKTLPLSPALSIFVN
jgi:hypothetical protein